MINTVPVELTTAQKQKAFVIRFKTQTGEWGKFFAGFTPDGTPELCDFVEQAVIYYDNQPDHYNYRLLYPVFAKLINEIKHQPIRQAYIDAKLESDVRKLASRQTFKALLNSDVGVYPILHYRTAANINRILAEME